MKNFLVILRYVWRYKTFAFFNLFSNLLTILFSLVSLTMIIPFLQLLFDTKVTQLSTLPVPPVPDFSIHYLLSLFDYHFIKYILDAPSVKEGKQQALLFVCLFVVAIFFLKNIFRYLALFFLAPVRYYVVRDIRNDLYRKMLSLPLSYFSGEKKGHLITRITSDVQEIEYGIISMLEITFKEPLTILAFLGAMLFMSPQLTLFVLLMLLITGGIVGRIGKSLKRVSKRSQDRLGDLISMVEETIGGMRIVKAFTAEQQLGQKFEQQNNVYRKLMMRIQRKKDLSSPLTEFLAIGIIATVLYYGGMLVLNRDQSLGLAPEEFIAFMLIFSQLIPPAKSFSTAFYNIQKGLASMERIGQLLEAEEKIHEAVNPLRIQEFRNELQFENVSFSYYNYDDKKILENVNLSIKRGKMIAIVGQSGAGKSTMADLIPRFYDTISGRILIDGIDIKQYKVSDLRQLMGIVTQEAILFNDTVYNNIAFGKENQNQEAIEQAAKVANAHEFIMRLPEGYKTYIGDRGNKLSGGERQRLTIARAILHDPPILILDEATSALDSTSEKLVQEAIYKLMRNRTSIVIAHRLSTIQFADEIIVMDKGKIAERGNHIGLMAKNGLYRKLVDMQAF